MPLLYLIRHAACDSVGRYLAPDELRLNARGEAQVRALADRLAPRPFDAICSSPAVRARQTAEGLARGRDVRVIDGLRDLDFGAWAGRTFEDLDRLPAWQRFNALRSTARPPGGESMVEVQARALREIERIVEAHPDGAVAVVTHADVIKAVLLCCLGMPLDHLHRLEISPASLSVVLMEPRQVRVLSVNDTGGDV